MVIAISTTHAHAHTPAVTEDDVIEQWRTDQQRETFVCYYGNEFFRDLDGHFGDVSKDFYTW